MDTRVAGVLVGHVEAHRAEVGRPPLQQIFGIASEEGVDAAIFSKPAYTKMATGLPDNTGISLLIVTSNGEDFHVRTANTPATRLALSRC